MNFDETFVVDKIYLNNVLLENENTNNQYIYKLKMNNKAQRKYKNKKKAEHSFSPQMCSPEKLVIINL